MTFRPAEVNLVIYHANCTDGFAAAFAAWNTLGDRATYIPAAYGDAPPDVSGKNVLIVDFSYSREDLLRMRGEARSILVLDHHKTAQAALEGLDFVQFDLKCSGAMMTWSLFNPDEFPPDLIRYIQDRDLWLWKLPQTREFSMGLMSVPHDFGAYAALMHAGAVRSTIERGQAVVGFMDSEIASLCKHAVHRRLRAAPHLSCGVLNTHMWVSEVGARICQDYDVAAMWNLDLNSKKWRVSLRSREGVDVAGIARDFGGGGHTGAAGFSLPGDVSIESIFLDPRDMGSDVDGDLQERVEKVT